MPGLTSKKLPGLRKKEACSTGMHGQSSHRGMCVTPRVCHSTRSAPSSDRFCKATTRTIDRINRRAIQCKLHCLGCLQAATILVGKHLSTSPPLYAVTSDQASAQHRLLVWEFSDAAKEGAVSTENGNIRMQKWR